jgi:uncharacterized membrane protein
LPTSNAKKIEKKRKGKFIESLSRVLLNWLLMMVIVGVAACVVVSSVIVNDCLAVVAGSVMVVRWIAVVIGVRIIVVSVPVAIVVI